MEFIFLGLSIIYFILSCVLFRKRGYADSGFSLLLTLIFIIAFLKS